MVVAITFEGKILGVTDNVPGSVYNALVKGNGNQWIFQSFRPGTACTKLQIEYAVVGENLNMYVMVGPYVNTRPANRIVLRTGTPAEALGLLDEAARGETVVGCEIHTVYLSSSTPGVNCDPVVSGTSAWETVVNPLCTPLNQACPSGGSEVYDAYKQDFFAFLGEAGDSFTADPFGDPFTVTATTTCQKWSASLISFPCSGPLAYSSTQSASLISDTTVSDPR